jgi:hypothetical protein
MNYFIHHRRGVCHTNYSKLTPNNYNNQKCIVVSAKNKGELNGADKTFNDKTWLENSCELQGINHISLIMDTTAEETAYVSKPKYVYQYLLNCNYEYVLVSDSTDCIIFKNPDDAISLLDEYECDILYGVSRFSDWAEFTMPERYSFNKSINGQFSVNGGVCLAKTSELLKLYKKVLEYADDSLSWLDYHKIYRCNNGYKNWSKEQLSEFPKGVSCDQVIIKYLFKDFYPKLKLDTFGKLTNTR